MYFTDHMLFLLAGLGVVNALLLAGYCGLVLTKKNWHNWLLAGLLLALSIRIGKSILYVFYDLDRWVLQLGLSACICIGPFLWLYLKAIRGGNLTGRWWTIHLSGPLFTILAIGLVWPYESHPWAWNYRIVYFIYAVWGAYLAHALYIHRDLLVRLRRPGQLDPLAGWAGLLLVAMTVLYLSYAMALFGFPYLVGPLLFTTIFYLLFAYLLLNARGQQILTPKLVSAFDESVHPTMLDRQVSRSKQIRKDHSTASVSQDQAALLSKTVQLIERERLFLNPALKLNDLAEQLGLSPHDLSRCINEASGISFNHFINQFRVAEACQLLACQHHLTIEGIGQEAGFASRSAFYRAFKQEMKLTPASYKIQCLTKRPAKLS